MGLISEDYFNEPIDPTFRPDEKPLAEQQEEDFGFFDYAGDIAAAPFRGIAGAVEGIAEIGNIIPGVDYDIAANLGLGESKTFVGGAVEGITEFATAFIPVAGWVGRGAKVAKMGKMAGGLEKAAKLKGAKGWAARRGQEAVAGGIADFLVIQGHEARLSDLIEQFPGLQNPVTEFLQSDEDDPEIVGRLKAAVEGLGAGIVFDSFLLGIKALRKGKQAFNDGVAKGLSEEAADKKAAEAMDEVQRETTQGPGVIKRFGPDPNDPHGFSYSFEDTQVHVDLEEGSLFIGAKMQDPEQVQKINDALVNALEHAEGLGVKALKVDDDSLPAFEDFVVGGSGLDVRLRKRHSELSLESRGRSVEDPLPLETLQNRTGTPPRFVRVAHGTKLTDDELNFPEAAAGSEGLHVGTYSAAAERVGLRSKTTSSGLGLLSTHGTGEPRVLDRVLDTSRIAHLEDPISDQEVAAFLKNADPGISGVAYINDVEDPGSISFAVRDASALKEAKETAPKTLDDAAGSGGPTRSDFRHGGEEAVDDAMLEEMAYPNPKRKRGTDNIFKRLELETNLSGDRSQLEGVRTFMDEMGPGYFDDLGISIHRNLRPKGRMEFGSEIIRIAKRTVEQGELEDTMIHELWHKLSQNLPEKDVRAVRKAYQKALDKQPVIKELLEEGSFDQARYDELVAKHGKEKVDAVVRKDGDSYSLSINNRENYRFTDEDEWFAETMREVTQGRLDFLDEAAPSGTVKRLFQDLGIIFRDLWVYTKEKFGFAGPEQRIFNDFLRGKRLKKQRFGGLQGGSSARMADDAAGSGGKPPEVPPGRAAGDGGDVPDPSGDVGAVQARREELDVEGVVDVQTGRLNLRGVAGEPKKIIRAVEDALEDQIDAELGDLSDTELIADNLESLADMMGISPEQLTKEIGGDRSSVRAVNRRVLAYKKVIETMTDDRLKPALDAVKKAKQETGTVDAETLLRAEHELAAISEVITAMRGLRREQSQGLRIMKYSDVFFDVANAGDTADALARGRDALLEELGGREGLVKRIETITALLEHGGLDAALKGLKKQRGNKYLLMLNEGFINNILSGPKTLTTNFLGPMLVSMYRPLENALGGLLTGDAKIVRRSLREFTGLFSGWSDSLRMARMALANDELILDPTARQVDLPGSQRRAISAAGMEISENSGAGKILDVIGKALGLPTRALGGTDEFVKQLNYRSVVRADLTEQGIEKGLSGVQLAEFVDNGMDNIVINGAALTARNLDREATKMGLSGAEKTKFIAERIEASDPALAQRALDIARDVTFTRELSPDQSQFRKLSRKAQMAVNAHPGLRPFIPFIRTPVNLLSFAGERTVDQAMGLVRLLNPLSRTTPKEFKIAHGNRSRLMADLASEDPQRRAEAYGRTMAGLAFTVTGVGLTANGNLTGGGPKDYKQRKLLEEAGWQPYSIKVGDDYYSYQRMDPFASMLGIFADISDINRYAPPEMQAEVESVGLNMAIAVARNIGSKTYLQGVMDLAGLMENPERFVGTTTRKFAGSMVPFSGLLGQGVQAVGGDESMREVRTMLDAMQAKIPFLSDGLDPQRNFMGEPSERYMALGGRWTDWWLPIVHSTTSSDPINREVAALGHTFSPPSSNRYNEDLRQIVSPSGQSAYDRWMELHQEVRIGGRSLNQAVNRLIRSAKYRRMSAEGFGDEKSPRVREINKLVGRYRAKAEAQMLREFPQVNTAKKNKMVTRRSLRTGQSADSIRASLFPLD